MIEKKDILKMARHVFKRSEGYADHEIMHPQREWGVGMTVALLILCAGGYMAANEYYSFDIDSAVPDSSNIRNIPYRSAQVAEAIEIYDARQARFDSLAAAPVISVPKDDGAVATTTDEIVVEEVSTEDVLVEEDENTADVDVTESTPVNEESEVELEDEDEEPDADVVPSPQPEF